MFLKTGKQFSLFKGFEPSHRYYESNLPDYHPKQHNSTLDRKENKESRFGIIPATSFGSSGSGVQYGNGNGNGGVGYVISPMKIDIGGVALGALIGLGAMLIVPKLMNILSSGHGGYRSKGFEPSHRYYESNLPDYHPKQHNSTLDRKKTRNLDSELFQQQPWAVLVVVCNMEMAMETRGVGYVINPMKIDNRRVATGSFNWTGGNVDCSKGLMNILSSGHGEYRSLEDGINTLFSYVLDGTAIKQAVEIGKAGDLEKCSTLYPKCPVTKENILKVISSLLPA
ncbi:hypothetical protein NQ317_000433 [Molorchus minor]|uniref:Uncharacterized protein n=1 Tax=Molorchus minor TaxID=1323400 RepID=A0ABQ9IUH1_9CUCU|nr:hypothetical protein NQ317_000433 [Molorchus minor]